MFGLLRRGRKAQAGATHPALHWDLHAHLLPGVDDGVRTMDDALESIRALQALGYRASVLTPHIYHELYPNTRTTLEPVFAALQNALQEVGVEHGLHLAAEYFVDEHFIKLVEDRALLSFGPRAGFVLVEFPYQSEPLLWADALSALVRNGYTPVIAHIERYRFVVRAPEVWLDRFAQFDAKIQCNLGSLVGQYGPEASQFARRMLQQRLPTFWGTDLHRAKQVAHFVAPALGYVAELGELNAALLA